MKKSNWRGFTLQLFLITIMPLTVLLLVVAFGSQTLHHEAMRSLVGDRDLRTVRAASSSIEREVTHLTGTIQLIAREMGDQPDFSSITFHNRRNCLYIRRGYRPLHQGWQLDPRYYNRIGLADHPGPGSRSIQSVSAR